MWNLLTNILLQYLYYLIKLKAEKLYLSVVDKTASVPFLPKIKIDSY